MKRDRYYCDLCERPIDNYNPEGNVYLDGYGDNQIWPTSGGKKDVCKNCCITLWEAQKFGLIKQIDRAPLYIQAGFVYDKDNKVWVRQ